MTTYQIENFWNFDSFPNCQIKIIFFGTEQFQKFDYFMNLSIIEIWQFWKFQEFPKSENKKFLEIF